MLRLMLELIVAREVLVDDREGGALRVPARLEWHQAIHLRAHR